MAIAYPLDKTASSADNYIVGEIHDVPIGTTKIVVPLHSPFYTNNLAIYDNVSNQQLVRGVDYQLGELHKDATLHTGHEVYQIIILTNDNLSNQVRINYQTVGGEYSYPIPAIANLYQQVINRNDPVDWNRVVNKPEVYPPSLHTHWMSDIYGFQAIVDALERIRNAIVMSDVPTIQALIDWVDYRMEKYPADRYMLVAKNERVPDGEIVEFILGTKDLYNNEQFNWTVEHITTEPYMIQTLSGQVNVLLDRGTFIVKTTLSGIVNEKQFVVKIIDNNGNLITTSNPITIIPRL